MALAIALRRKQIPASPAWSSRGALWRAIAFLVVGTLAAYFNSYRGPFIFDDPAAILDNATLRDLTDLRTVLSPPAEGMTVSGRPLINLSLAINYAISGENVWSYHAFNVLIHLFAGLLLFGVVRRTLLLPALRPRFGDAALPLSFAVALLWLVHPLQTESVTYIVQRAESIAGAFYLLTLYAFIRACDDNQDNVRSAATPITFRRRAWSAIAVVACLSGMASKEIMVSAPLFVLLFDRTLIAGGFRAALRARGSLHAALFATWALLAWLVFAAGTRGNAAGFGLGVHPYDYALTQAGAIVHYLRLSFWPHPLVLDYGFAVTTSPLTVLPQLLILAAAVAATAIALVKQSPLALPAVWFFAILAPSSSIMPVATQTMAEHRMYLPLAAVVLGAVMLAYRFAKCGGVQAFSAVAGLALVATTLARNADYASALRIWVDTAAKRPDNPRAHQQVGTAYAALGNHREAVVHYARSEALLPDEGANLVNYAYSLSVLGRTAEAEARYMRALQLIPQSPDLHYNYANLLAQSGRLTGAIQHFREAIRVNPRMHLAHNNLGTALVNAGQPMEAIAAYEESLKQAPGFVDAHFNLGNTLAALGRTTEALAHYHAALAAAPAHANACANIGALLFNTGQREEGLRFLERATQLAPERADLHAKLAAARDEAAGP